MKPLCYFFLLFFALSAASQPPRSYLIDCGATVSRVINDREWLPDTDYIAGGTPKNLSLPVLDPTLSTVRTFPVAENNNKFCYVLPVFRGGKYMVRTTYFYGGVNGDANPNPPVFDQILEGTLWAVVNTTEDFLNGMSTYYEGVFLAAGKTMSVCIGANKYTESDPFISALELVLLPESLYNSTDFRKYALSLSARHSFGYNGPIIRYPADQFDRYWEPFGEQSPALNFSKVSVSNIWNQPPINVFQTRMTISKSEPMELLWPPYPLPSATYYVALYFANDQDSSSARVRVFNISLNDLLFYHDLNVAPAGVMVFANQWPLSGITNITLTPPPASSLAPLINAGEIFQVLPLGGRTLTRDVIALGNLKASFKNPPLDWNGDPCLPTQYSWTGVVCSGGTRIRVTALNLTGMGLSGMLSSSIGNLTALTGIWLGKNNLSGSIPDLFSLKRLEILHLEDNQLGGEITPSLGSIESLRELFVQNNNLTGQIPSSILGKPGIDLRTTPGNPFLSRPLN